MVDALLIIAIGAIILLWIDRKSMKETIEHQEYKIRHLTGKQNEDDKREKKQRLDDYHYDKIIRQIMQDDEYAYMTPDEIIYENANKRFLEVYGYEYVGNVEINRNVCLRVNIYTDSFDTYIKDFFPNTKEDAINKMMHKLNISQQESVILFERWKKYYLIDCYSGEDWVLNTPKETLTIEQFKDRMSVCRIDVKKDNEGLLCFECGEIKGLVLLKELPHNPMISLFVASNSEEHWVLHEEGAISTPPALAVF